MQWTAPTGHCKSLPGLLAVAFPLQARPREIFGDALGRHCMTNCIFERARRGGPVGGCRGGGDVEHYARQWSPSMQLLGAPVCQYCWHVAQNLEVDTPAGLVMESVSASSGDAVTEWESVVLVFSAQTFATTTHCPWRRGRFGPVACAQKTQKHHLNQKNVFHKEFRPKSCWAVGESPARKV